MTQEEKQLLLKDLSARLSYLVKVSTTDNDGSLENVWDIHLYNTFTEDVNIIHSTENVSRLVDISEIRPYLRPMSSMTKEEKIDYERLCSYCLEQDTVNYNITTLDRTQLVYVIDWLNKNHFDYRDLIEQGLAIEAPEGMYD